MTNTLSDRSVGPRTERALELRATGASITVIAAQMALPRTTVGKLLRGIGAPSYRVICEVCGTVTDSARRHARYCGSTCRGRAFRSRTTTTKEGR